MKVGMCASVEKLGSLYLTLLSVPLQPKAAVKRVILLLAHGLDEGLWTELGQAAMPTLCREFGPHPVTVLARKPNLVPGALMCSSCSSLGLLVC